MSTSCLKSWANVFFFGRMQNFHLSTQGLYWEACEETVDMQHSDPTSSKSSRDFKLKQVPVNGIFKRLRYLSFTGSSRITVPAFGYCKNRGTDCVEATNENGFTAVCSLTLRIGENLVDTRHCCIFSLERHRSQVLYE